MSGYAERPFSSRLGQMGDQAEGVFEEVAPLGTWVRYGWNRNAQFGRMPLHVRLTPDYFTNNGHLVEVMGCKGKEFRALKLEKFEGLKEWNRLAEQKLRYFVWNSEYRTWVLITHRAMAALVRRCIEGEMIGKWESDGNEYYRIPWGWLLAASTKKDGMRGSIQL